MSLLTVLIRPVITEKSLSLSTHGQYTFEIDRRANKLEVADAVAKIYKVKVMHVSVIPVIPKSVRRRRGSGLTRRWKKAVVTLAKGQKISGFEIEVEKPKDAKKDSATDKK